MTPDITVIMGTLLEREELRAQMLGSVEDQTVPPAHVLYEIDKNHRGVILVYNGLARQVTTEWLFPFADDDLLDPDHFETLAPYLNDEADIVYTWCRLTGNDKMGESTFQVEIPEDEVERKTFFENLRLNNCIPGSAAIRTSLWRHLGGYAPADQRNAPEDWDFWLRACDAGARFRCIPKVTWTYRIDPTWKHESKIEERLG